MKTIPTIALCLAAIGLLGACDGPPARPPATTSAEAHPAVAGVDTPATPAPKARAEAPAAPFVTPTKIGRLLGDKSPSPPASRTR